jgi:hypothetical protein
MCLKYLIWGDGSGRGGEEWWVKEWGKAQPEKDSLSTQLLIKLRRALPARAKEKRERQR